MDISLASANPLTRDTALRLISYSRIFLMIVAVLLAVLALAIRNIEASAWFQRRLREGSTFPKTYEKHQRQFGRGTALIAFCGLLAAVLYVTLGANLSSQLLPLINAEDGVIEYLSAFLLLAASVVALWNGLAMPDKAHKAMHLFLAILFFVMCGEEISWGQRIFGFSTPESLQDINVQNETNLHNSFGYIFDHLFILGFFAWGCIIPLLYWSEPIWRWFQSRIGLPLPSVGLSIVMLGVTLFQEQVTDTVLGVVPGLRVAELRELLSALCFLMMMVESRGLAARQPQTKFG